MLYPSIDSLLKKVPSKYLLVTLAAKRARNMLDTKEYAMENYQSVKKVGKSLEEIDAGILTIDTSDENTPSAATSDTEE